MKKTSSLLAAVVGLLLALAPVGAHAADDYADPGITISIPSTVIVGGDDLTVTVTSPTSCRWTLTFLDQVAKGTGKTFTHTFTTPVVQQRTEVPLNVTCDYDAVGGGTTSATASRTSTIVLLPRDAAIPASTGALGGILPATGGPTLWLLVAGGVLVLAGGALTVVRKRS